jgi:hypothetical protein
MAIIGKGSSSFKKKDVMEQKGIALGFKKVRFAHKATAGDTGISLTALVQPTEMSTYGFTNPSSATLAAAQLNKFRNNLKLTSSLRGLLVDQLSYVVASSTQINFIDFTAEDGEIFTGWLDEAPTTSLSVVDGSPIVATGILLAGQTDFNIGMPIVINENPAQQIGAVMAYVDRGLAYRKVGNTASGDGDYIEVPVAGGLGSLLRFNPSGVDRFITVVSNGVVAERPDGSMTAMIERVQGQVDQMVPTLAALAGVPETNFQTGPNDVDLKQFGDLVLELNRLKEIEVELPRKYHEIGHSGSGNTLLHSSGIKFDPSNITNSGNNTGLLTFDNSNATQTRWYATKTLKVNCSARMFINDVTVNAYIHIQRNGVSLMTSAEISANPSLVHASVEMILNPGDYLNLTLPLGNAATANDVIVRIVAESLDEQALLGDLL